MKVEKIILNGCSFVHGFDMCFREFGTRDYERYDIAEQSWTIEQKTIFNKKRLAGQLGDYFNCEVIDLSISGEANHRISTSTINYVEENKSDLDPDTTLVLIGWTDITRAAFRLSNIQTNFSIFSIEGHIKFTESLDTDKFSQELLKIYSEFLPLKTIYDENPSMINSHYQDYFSLILLTQLYMNKMGIRCYMWNSLPNWPQLPDYKYDYKNLSDIVNWDRFWPHGTIESHEISWGDSLVDNPEKYLTASGHPTDIAAQEFIASLTKFIESKN
jgi:hypothetical protein